jgi:hypothetical protein
MTPILHPSSRPSLTGAAEIACAVDRDICDQVVAVLRDTDAHVLANERVVVGAPAAGCPPWARCAAQLSFTALAVGANSGWSSLDDLDFVLVSGGTRPEATKTIDSSTVSLETLRLLPSPSLPSPHGNVAWSVKELTRRPLSDEPTTLVVEGWLAATPSMECRRQPVPSGQLDFGCDEQDWLTDTEFQPWGGHSNLAPKEGIRVPNRSYDSFAWFPSPSGDRTARAPRFGAYLVHTRVGSACEYFQPSTSGLPCSGPPVWFVEITDRISP